MAPEERERIRRLVRELSQSVNNLMSESSDVKDAIREIEEGGYEVDLLFALFTRILRKKDEPVRLEETPSPTDFDAEFLKGLRLNWSMD